MIYASQKNYVESNISNKLNSAVLVQDLESLKQLIEVDKLDPNALDYDRRSPLHLATSSGNAQIVKYLLDAGAKMDIDRYGLLPINYTSDPEIFELLLQNGFDPAQIVKQSEIAHVDPAKLEVIRLMMLSGNASYNKIITEVHKFYNVYGIDKFYFKTYSTEIIAKHITGLISGKNICNITGNYDNLNYRIVLENSYFAATARAYLKDAIMDMEAYMNHPEQAQNQSFCTFIRSTKPFSKSSSQFLNLINLLSYRSADRSQSSNIDEICSPEIIQILKNNTNMYSDLKEILQTHANSPGVQFEFKTREDGRRVIYMHSKRGMKPNEVSKAGTFMNYTIFQLSKYLQLKLVKIYSLNFSNDSHIYTIYYDSITDEQVQTVTSKLTDLAHIPEWSPFLDLYNKNPIKYSSKCITYLSAATNMAFYMYSLKNSDLDSLYNKLSNDKHYTDKVDYLSQYIIGRPTYEEITNTVFRNEDLSYQLYNDYETQLLSSRSSESEANTNSTLLTLINNHPDISVREVYLKMYLFNRSIRATNVQKTPRSANAFRLDLSELLDKTRYKEMPYGVYFVFNHSFRGFHIRFRDIARGGIRIVKSNEVNYDTNRHELFNEVYNLAYTQTLKNKDIAESGSKGVINPYHGFNYLDKNSFLEYQDAIIDIMNKEEDVVYKLDHDEILFFGPDENTADKMDIAYEHAQKRGYKYAATCSTGKSPNYGGIPHDTYGMTTRSVRQYVTGIYKKLNLNQHEVTKVITGGPDGDLGSNEILMGKERFVAIIDGSGVLYDPQGLDKNELDYLAQHRATADGYRGTLSSEGFMVKTTDTNVTANGETVVSGESFRNGFLFRDYLQADILVPCGGRPESVNFSNFTKLFSEHGLPKFKYIVEGANLFVSENIRPRLQDRGVLLFKDASTNKGGVTSSSLEVLLGLCLTPEEHKQWVVQPDGTIPENYANYVTEIIRRVEENARLEFEYVYNGIQAGAYSNQVTNELSLRMNQLNDNISNSQLYQNNVLRDNVLKKYIPKILLEKYDYEYLFNNMPENYRKAAFSTFLSSTFIYQNVGIDNNEIKFTEFIDNYKQIRL